jgi:hypothetical protein
MIAVFQAEKTVAKTKGGVFVGDPSLAAAENLINRRKRRDPYPPKFARLFRRIVEAASGFEPLHRGFADLSLNHLGTPPLAGRTLVFIMARLLSQSALRRVGIEGCL